MNFARHPYPASAHTIDGLSLGLLSFTVLIWASSFTAIRVGLTAFGPIELGALRFLIAAVPAAIYLAITRPPLPRRDEVWRFAVGGVFYIALYTVLLNTGEQTVPAGAASFIINVSPIITAFFAVIHLGEHFPARAWLGTALSFAGIGLIAYGEGSGLSFNTDALLILGAACCTAAGTIAQKPLFVRHGALTVSAWNMVTGTLCLSPALPGGFAALPHASAHAIVALFFLGLVASLVAYTTWTIALSRLPASRASNFLYCIPPVATLMGFLLLGEVPGLFGIAGGALSLLGVILVNLRPRRAIAAGS